MIFSTLQAYVPEYGGRFILSFIETEKKHKHTHSNKSYWYLIWNVIHPCIYICTPDFKLTPVRRGATFAISMPIFIIFDEFVRKIIITIPFLPQRDESQYKMHPVRDELRETDAHCVRLCVWKLLASFPIHFDGRYYIDYISMHTRWKICNDVDGGF